MPIDIVYFKNSVYIHYKNKIKTNVNRTVSVGAMIQRKMSFRSEENRR